MEFEKLQRASRSLEGYRLATVRDVQENWEMIKELGILDTWSILRLVDGIVNGAGYEYKPIVRWISIRYMHEMLLVKSPDESTISGHNSRIREKLYSGITLDEEGKKVALALACDDKNLEIIYWILQNTDESELHTLTAFVDEKLGNAKPLLHYIVEADMYYKDDEIVSVAHLLISKYEIGKRTVVAKDNYERSFLHFASLCGRPRLCRFLMHNHHLRADTKDRFGQNALHFAAARGPQKEEGEMVTQELLWQLSNDPREETDVEIVDSKDGKQRTPLHIAASTGYTQMVEQLLWSKRGNTEEYIRRADIFGQTALLAAVRGGHKEVVGKLLEYGSHPLYERDSEGNTSLHLAVRLEDESVARDIIQLLSEKCESEEEKSLLLWASATGMGTAQDVSRFSSVTGLLRKQRDAISSHQNLLRTAATLGNKEMSRELLHGGANIDDIKDHAWQQKLENQHRKVVEKVIRDIEFIPERGRDKPATMDNLGRRDFAFGLAALFLNPYIKTPITVGISGEWGMGKSSLMIQTENIMLITAAQQAFPHLFIQIENFPGARKISLNKKGRRTHKKITTAVRILLGTQKLKELKEDPVAHVLQEYQPQYDALFKSLACMDRSDMFMTEGNKGVPGGPAILTVRYNAWHYRNEGEAWAGLAVTITREIEARMTAAQSLTTRYRYAWKTQRGSIYLEFILPAVLATIIAVCVAWAAITLLFRSNRKELQALKYGSVPATLIAIVWAVVKSVISVLKPISTQMRRYLTLPENSERLGYQQKVIDDITFLREEISRKPKRFFSFIAGEWCRNWFGMCHNNSECAAIPRVKPASKDNLRIIVFVDDLDRCEEKIILKVLSAVNLVLVACEISVIMGIDNRMIARAIIKEFKHQGERNSLEDLAENYIRKIIQLPLALPDPNDAESKSFLGALLGPSNQEDTSQVSHENSQHSEDTRSFVLPDAVEIIHSGECPANNFKVEEDARGLIHKSGKAILSCFLKMQKWFAHNENEYKGNEPGNVLWTRKILMVNCSNSEREAFEYLRLYATGNQKVPREWKRLLNYHRLAWAILVINGMNTKSLLPSGWPVQLVAWIFACWQWKCQLNFIILRWQKDIVHVKQSELETSEAGPSLRDIVEHYIDKMWPSKQNLDSNNGGSQIGSSQETDKIEKQQEQERKQEQEQKEKREEWLKLGEVLNKYDVTMTSIQRFQRFRLNCNSGHLPWPLPKGDNGPQGTRTDVVFD